MSGGLGNQLFQFAAAVALRSHQQKINIHTSSLQHYRVKRRFDLEGLLGLPDYCLVDIPDWRYALTSRLRLGRLTPYLGVNDKNFSRHLAHARRGNHRRTLFLDGYFQREWDFDQFQHILRMMSRMLKNNAIESSHFNQYAAIHIRGGDFLTTDEACVVDANYYINALAVLRQEFPELKRIILVSDDVPYANSIFNSIRLLHRSCEFSTAMEPSIGAAWLRDFFILKNATARIIGNSTFAWWASALDERGALTISPNKWLLNVPRDVFLPWEVVLDV